MNRESDQAGTFEPNPSNRRRHTADSSNTRVAILSKVTRISLASRTCRLIKTLVPPRSVLLVVALVGILVSSLADGPPKILAITTGLLSLGALLALISRRQSIQHSGMKRTEKDLIRVGSSLQDNAGSLTKLQSNLNKLQSELDLSRESFTNTQTAIESLTKTNISLEQGITALSKRIEEETAHTVELSKRVDQEFAEAVTRADQISNTVGLLEGSLSQRLNRELPPATVDELLDVWCPRLEVTQTKCSAYYLARKFLFVEASSLGRLAASIGDGVFRAVVASSLRNLPPSLLEIGVLFGINAAYLWDVEGFDRSGFCQTLIDPFSGYYGKERDSFTGLRVTKEMTESNLRRVDAPPDSYRILQGYSTDPEIMAQASDRKYSLIFIDGDHSYEGVKFDFDNYSPLCEQGGIIMIDDYGAPAWPGVTQFVDELLANQDGFEHVGTWLTTALFRRI